MKTNTYLFFALFFGLFFLSAAATTVYKWTDANGQVHYSDKPPPDQQAEVRTIKTPRPARRDGQTPVPADDSPEKTPATQQGDTADQEKLKQAEEARKKAVRRQNCQIARKNLETLSTMIRVRRQNPETGEWERMTDVQRARKLKEYKKKIREYCR